MRSNIARMPQTEAVSLNGLKRLRAKEQGLTISRDKLLKTQTMLQKSLAEIDELIREVRREKRRDEWLLRAGSTIE
jgi:hypothetical protein